MQAKIEMEPVCHGALWLRRPQAYRRLATAAATPSVALHGVARLSRQRLRVARRLTPRRAPSAPGPMLRRARVVLACRG